MVTQLSAQQRGTLFDGLLCFVKQNIIPTAGFRFERVSYQPHGSTDICYKTPDLVLQSNSNVHFGEWCNTNDLRTLTLSSQVNPSFSKVLTIMRNMLFYTNDDSWAIQTAINAAYTEIQQYGPCKAVIKTSNEFGIQSTEGATQ